MYCLVKMQQLYKRLYGDMHMNAPSLVCTSSTNDSVAALGGIVDSVTIKGTALYYALYMQCTQLSLHYYT